MKTKNYNDGRLIDTAFESYSREIPSDDAKVKEARIIVVTTTICMWIITRAWRSPVENVRVVNKGDNDNVSRMNASMMVPAIPKLFPFLWNPKSLHHSDSRVD
jgi:hypothetical protein